MAIAANIIEGSSLRESENHLCHIANRFAKLCYWPNASTDAALTKAARVY